MSDGYMSTSEMMSSCGMTARMNFRTAYIIPALEEGAIERKYPDKPKHPQQRYRLTEKAKTWKQSNKTVMLLRSGSLNN